MKKAQRKKRLFILIPVLAISVFCLFLQSDGVTANYLEKENLSSITAPGKGSRVLVIAPHPDDEVIGAAMLIKKTLSNGGQVKVVLVTNGDGYQSAVRLDYAKVALKPADYISFGYKRQSETRKALTSLGLLESDIFFLGYPDSGMTSLWTANWDSSNPYTSRYTKTDRSPYTDSYTKNSLYCGRNVVADLSKIITNFQPTIVVMPHPNDKHPDHWAANAFMVYTLTLLHDTPQRELLYLVHRGLWPTAETGDTNNTLYPPAKLDETGTNWDELALSSDEITQKKSTLLLYQTQLKVLGYQMTCFDKKNELFGEYPNAGLIHGLKDDAAIAAEAGNVIIRDPSQDTLSLNINRGGDLVTVYAERSKQNTLHLFLETYTAINSINQYRFSLIFFNGQKTTRLYLLVQDGYLYSLDSAGKTLTALPGLGLTVSGNTLHITVQQQVTGDYDGIFVNTSSYFEKYMVDKTAWRMVGL